MVRLRLDSQPTSFAFQAGQYTAILHPDGTAIPFSIASAPHRLPELEIHFQPLAGNDDAERMLDLLAAGGPVQLQPPAGNVYLDATEKALFFICGGSGIAQAWGMLEQLDHQTKRPKVGLLWCVDAPNLLYLGERLHSLDFLEPVIFVDERRNEDNAGMAWLDEHAADLQHSRIVLCGGPAFVWAAVDVLQPSGGGTLDLASDVFDYAPR